MEWTYKGSLEQKKKCILGMGVKPKSMDDGSLRGQGWGPKASYSPDFLLEGHSGDTPLLLINSAMDPRNLFQTGKKPKGKNIFR
jgi:hypothetical protein